MKSDYKKFYFFLAPLAFLFIFSVSFTSCDEQDDDAYIDLRIFEGSWYHEGSENTTVISFFRSIVYKDIIKDDKITEHTEYGMIESVSKTTIRVNGKTCEYRFESSKLYLKEVVVEDEPNNNVWMEFVIGKPLYDN